MKDLRDNGRIILAYGEVTGHCHEVIADATGLPPDMAQAQYFEGKDGLRELIILEPCTLVHEEHGRIALDPAHPEQVRQGDVLLNPTGPGSYVMKLPDEWVGPEQWRSIAD